MKHLFFKALTPPPFFALADQDIWVLHQINLNRNFTQTITTQLQNQLCIDSVLDKWKKNIIWIILTPFWPHPLHIPLSRTSLTHTYRAYTCRHKHQPNLDRVERVLANNIPSSHVFIKEKKIVSNWFSARCSKSNLTHAYRAKNNNPILTVLSAFLHSFMAYRKSALYSSVLEINEKRHFTLPWPLFSLLSPEPI